MPEKICSPSNTATVKIINPFETMIMKRIDTILRAAAVLAAALVSCSEAEIDPAPAPVPEESFAVTLVASQEIDDATRTVLHEDGSVWWLPGKEQVRFMETVGGTTGHQTSNYGATSDGGRTMTFQVWMENVQQSQEGPYVYQTVYPHLSCVDKTSYAGDYPVRLPAAQTPSATSFDPTADLLVGKPIVMDRRITSADKNISIRFHRMIAVGRMTIKGVRSSDPVTSVRFSAPGKVLAGICRLNLLENEVLQYGSAEASESIELDCSALGLTADVQMPVYFTCLPCELTAGDSFVVTVKTARQQFSKQVVVPAGRPIAFREGELSAFSVDMSGCEEQMPDADAVSLSGSALADLMLEPTLENERVFAGQIELSAGKMRIEASFGGEKRYLCPAPGFAEADGRTVRAALSTTPYEWTIPAAARYRVVIDGSTDNRSVAIYSPERDLQPLSVTFRPNNDAKLAEVTVEVTDLYVYGGPINNWSSAGRKLECSISAADPQVLIYQGASLGGELKFPIANSFGANPSKDNKPYDCTNAYCFSCPFSAEGTAQKMPISADVWTTMEGGSDAHRNCYFNLPSGTNFIIFDLRNMRIKVSKR